jgi:hypothetical protein
VTPAEATILDACMPNEETIKCYSMYNDDEVQAYILAKCNDQQSCKIELADILDASLGTPNCISKYAQFFA